MRTHVPATWLLANLLLPLIVFVFFGAFHESGIETIGFFFIFLMYSLLLSVPALITGVLADMLLQYLFKAGLFRFLAWLVIAMLIVLLNFLVLYLFMNDPISPAEIYLSYPAMISVFIASLLRMSSIFRFYHEKTIAPNESDTIL